MMRYYMHDGSAAFSFALAGYLSLEGALELEQAWRTASSVIGGRDLIVDLSYVTGVDDAGRELLLKWHAYGARLVAISAEARARVQSMTDLPVMLLGTSPKASTRLPFRTAALSLAAFYMLLFPATARAGSRTGTTWDHTSRDRGSVGLGDIGAALICSGKRPGRIWSHGELGGTTSRARL